MAAKYYSERASAITPSVKRHTASTSCKKSKVTCPICDDVIHDDSQDSIYCEGRCATWLRRRCAGLSKGAFSLLKDSSSPFHCPSCRLDAQSQEIATLKESVSVLSGELANLKLRLDSEVPQANSAVLSQSLPGEGFSSLPQVSHNHAHAAAASSSDKKFNLLFFGIAECPKGTKFHERLRLDHASISTVLQSAGPDLSSVSIRDCQRLGPYKDQPSRPRPLLVKFNSSRDVLAVLSARSQLTSTDGSHVYVKNDLTKEGRHFESILLKERWSLLKDGVDRKCVRIKGHKLYINSKLHGYATPSGYCKSPSLGDVAPSLRDLANSSVPASNGRVETSSETSVPASNGHVETSSLASLGANETSTKTNQSTQPLSLSAGLATSAPTQPPAPSDCPSSQRPLPSN